MSFPKYAYVSVCGSRPLSLACRPAAIGLLGLAAAGCASVYEGKYDWKDGWRQGDVVQVGAASELGKRQFSDCRDNKSAQHLASSRFASVSYSHMTRKRRRVVPIQPGDSFRPGDEVYVNIASCTASLVREAPGSH